MMRKNFLKAASLIAITGLFIAGCATKTVYLTSDEYCQTPTLKAYTVKKGDSLNKIAKDNNTTQQCLIKLNHLKGDVITPKQRLYLPEVTQ